MQRSRIVAIAILVLAGCSAEDEPQANGPIGATPPPGAAGTFGAGTAGGPGLPGAPGGGLVPRSGNAAPPLSPGGPGIPLAGAAAPPAGVAGTAAPIPPGGAPIPPNDAPLPPAGTAGTAAPAGPPPATGGGEPRIPMPTGECPQIKSGMITVLGQQVRLWVGTKQEGKKGPIVFYWHGTGSTAAEASGGLGPGNSEVMAEGGVIASFTTTTKMGQNTGNNVWYTGDFAMSDQILACAIQQQNVDPRRVYTAGCSAGGLQASAMLYSRSSYLAGAMPNSGGSVIPFQYEDPSHIPALITTHGAMGRDVVGIDFSTSSATQTKAVAAKGGVVVNCDHGGGHCGSPAAVKAAQWQFLKDNPFGVTPRPYESGLPASFPSVCKLIK